MSPRFAPDLSKVRAGIRIFERGDYEVAIPEGGVKGMCYLKEVEGGKDYYVSGVRVLLEMVGKLKNDGQLDREFADETVTPARLYVHTEDAWGITKRFIMAALGYGLKDEERFDKDWTPNADLSIDGEGDEVALGSSWKELEGQHFVVTLDKETYEGREQQRHNNVLPVGAQRRVKKAAS